MGRSSVWPYNILAVTLAFRLLVDGGRTEANKEKNTSELALSTGHPSLIPDVRQ
jgi:hypothetical protein